jgi:hypothetical protein
MALLIAVGPAYHSGLYGSTSVGPALIIVAGILLYEHFRHPPRSISLRHDHSRVAGCRVRCSSRAWLLRLEARRASFGGSRLQVRPSLHGFFRICFLLGGPFAAQVWPKGALSGEKHAASIENASLFSGAEWRSYRVAIDIVELRRAGGGITAS